MDDVTPKDCFLQSVHRCLADTGFIPAFYERFLSSSDEIRNKFRFTDFEQQNKMLARSLLLAAGATAGEPSSLREIQDRAVTHDRHHLNISPELYVLWLDSLIATAEKFDGKWDKTVESSWRTILGHVVQHMARKY